MELLLRLLERRYLIPAAVLLAGLALLPLLPRRRPPANGPAEPNAAIARDLEAQKSARVRALHRRLSAEIAQAAAKGLAVGNLQRLADQALTLDRPGYRDAAATRLNQLRLMVPQTRERIRAEQDEGRVDPVPTPRSRAAPKRRAKPRRRPS